MGWVLDVLLLLCELVFVLFVVFDFLLVESGVDVEWCCGIE